MHSSAPRCQTQYLKSICQQASLSIDNHKPNGFILPESNHATTFLPPQPWLVTTKDTFISMCGQISLSCGMLQTNTNCRALAYEMHALTFQRYCPLSLRTTVTVPTHTTDDKTTDIHTTNNVINRLERRIKLNHLNQNNNYQANNNVNVVFNGIDAYNATVTVTKCLSKAPFDNNIYHYNRVFVVAQVDDTFIYHIHIEILPRIIYHLPFLLQNQDIKILFGCDVKNSIKATNKGLRQGLQAIQPMLEAIGISTDRLIIHKHVYAREIYLPMEGACQDPVYNTWQLLHMRQYFLDKLKLQKTQLNDDYHTSSTTTTITNSNTSTISPNADANTSTSNHHDNISDSIENNSSNTRRIDESNNSASYHNHYHSKPIMLLLKRSSNSRHTRNGHDLVRQWNNDFTMLLMNELQRTFINHYDIRIYSDRNESVMKCFECQIQIFHEAKVLIGVHGAGLSYMLYMQPNSAVVELAPYPNDGRCLLGGEIILNVYHHIPTLIIYHRYI